MPTVRSLGNNPGWDFPSSLDVGTIRGSDNQTLAANRAFWWRCQHGGIVTKIGFQVVTQSGNMSVGFYANTGVGRAAVPGAPIAVVGSTAVPAAGYAEISLGGTFVIPPGSWIALAADNTTAAFRCGVSGVAPVGSALGAGRLYLKDSSFPLPATTPTSLTAATGSPIVLVGA